MLVSSTNPEQSQQDLRNFFTNRVTDSIFMLPCDYEEIEKIIKSFQND